MNLIKVLEDSLTSFLQLMFRSSISFWTDREASGVAYLITSSVGLLIVSLARYQNYQETSWSDLIEVALPLLLVVFIGLGICVLFDRGLRESNNPSTLVVNASTTVLVCNLISCFFVWVMAFVPVFNLTIANVLGFAVISRNTVAKRSDPYFNWRRILIWGLVLFGFYPYILRNSCLRNFYLAKSGWWDRLSGDFD